MKTLKGGVIILLLFVIGFQFYFLINQKWEIKEVNKELNDWQDAYARFAITHDTLVDAYASLKKEFDLNDSLYKKKLETNQSKYEKIIAGFDTLNVDQHVELLSNFLSEKDKI